MALASKMVEFIGLRFEQQPAECGGVVKISIVKEESLAVDFFVAGQVIEPQPNCIARSSYKSVYGVAFFEQ